MLPIKAALLQGIENIKFADIPTPRCGDGDVLVRVKACGVCRTDMKAYRTGHRDLLLPRVLGHETAGVVAKAGHKVDCVRPGDRVQVAPGLSCGTCARCRTGMNHLCRQIKIMGFHHDGGFAEYALIPENGVKCGMLNRIPETLSFYEAALTEPLACCVNAQEAAGIGAGDSVVVFGAGPLGILNAKLARQRGAGRVILAEKKKSRIGAAKSAFDDIVHSGEEDAVAAILKLTDGAGVDAAIPCCPDPGAFMNSLSVLTRRGRLCFFSGLPASEMIPANGLNLIHYKELSVFGTYGCSSLHNRRALELLATGKIRVRDMTTRVLPLTALVQGMEMAANRKETNIIIDPTL